MQQVETNKGMILERVTKKSFVGPRNLFVLFKYSSYFQSFLCKKFKIDSRVKTLNEMADHILQ